MSLSNVLILSMYDVSWGDGWKDLSMSIGLTRYRPDSVCTQDRSTYSQFLNIAAKVPVGHDDTMIASFDIPVICGRLLHHCYLQEFVSFYIRR